MSVPRAVKLRKRLVVRQSRHFDYDTCMSKTESSMVELGTVAPAFELTDVVSGRAWGRDDVAATADGRGLMVMFICVHCPYVKHVEKELARIGADYAGRIAIAAISSNDVEGNARR